MNVDSLRDAKSKLTSKHDTKHNMREFIIVMSML